METENKKFRAYFLETLSHQEVEELELQIISDPDFASQLDAAETELLEDYLENSLSDDELKLFKNNFLVTRERQKRLEFLKSLKDFAKNTSVQSEFRESPASFFDFLSNLITPRKFGYALAGLVLLVVIGFGFNRLFYQNSISGDAEIIALNQKDLSNLEEFTTSKNLNLIPNLLRSGGNTPNLNEKNLSGNILIRLGLPNGITIADRQQINILKDGKIWQTFDSRIYQNQNGKEIRLLLPAAKLNRGEYLIQIETKGEKINYYFLVN